MGSHADRVARWQAFYRRENEGPLLGYFTDSEFPLHRYRAAAGLPEDRALRPDDFTVEGYLDDADRLFAAHEACGGDAIWSASAFWGISWLEAALGCPIWADHAAGSIHAETPATFNGAASLPEFDPASPWMVTCAEFLEALSAHAAGRYPLATTRMRGIADLLSALYGGEAFLYAMLEQPDEVDAVCRKLTDFWIAFGKLQLARIPAFHGGVGSFYYHAWAPAGTVWHQEDAAALLSPDIYDTFIRPCDRRISESFGGCIMHMHPAGFYPVDACLDMPRLTAVELHIDRGGPSAEALCDTHRRILERKPLLIWGELSAADLDWIFGKLPSRGLAVLAAVRDPAEAAAIESRYRA
ncbi:MAG: hypothetical protein JW951_04790 [Lentisphaerae bacterium]|nr:hypothetical protein [Lentisphaerota bacterium]